MTSRLLILLLSAALSLPLVAQTLPGDLDQSRQVDLHDLDILAAYWPDADCAEPNACALADLDLSSDINFLDYARLAHRWRLRDLITLDTHSLTPLQTLSITVQPVTTSCSLTVETPAGDLHTFAASVTDGVATASYVPSYLLGDYHLTALVDDTMPSETETFQVAYPATGQIQTTSFQASTLEYLPGENITFNVALADQLGQPLADFSGNYHDSLPNLGAGGLYIQRKIIAIDPNNNLIARLYVYFDTTGAPNIFGNNYAHIYAGTTINISLFAGDGSSTLDPAITVAPGFWNNDDNALTASITDNRWSVEVLSTIFQKEKIAYLDVTIPQAKSLSDVSFAVDYIKYNHNSGIGDRVYINNTFVAENQFPPGYEFTTGYKFSSLGRLPIHLPLNPKPQGLIFYYINYVDFPGHTLNHGNLASSQGDYTNTWKWNHTFDTTASVACYADKYGYTHACPNPLTLTLETVTRENLFLLDYNLDQRLYSVGDSRTFTATLKDEYANNVPGFRLAESVTDSNSGKLSIVSRNVATDELGNQVVRLLLYFDSTGSWSNIYPPTAVDISLFGPDGKSGLPLTIAVTPGSINADGYISYSLSETDRVYNWHVQVDTGFAGRDCQLFLDIAIPPTNSPSEVIYAVNHILYTSNPDWADFITIKNTTLPMSQFASSGAYNLYEFTTGDCFASLGFFPLYLSLNPNDASLYIKMDADPNNHTPLDGTLNDNSGAYTYTHAWPAAGGDNYTTAMAVSKYGYFNNKNHTTENITLYFSGEPRYLGGLDTQPVMIGDTYQVNLHDHFYIEPNYIDVEYLSSHPALVINANIAEFSPLSTDDTIYDLVITARKISDPLVAVACPPFTLYAANCADSYDCVTGEPNTFRACVQYQCQTYQLQNTYHNHPQGVDLSLLNETLSLSNPFPDPNQLVQICAEIANTSTTNIFDVTVNFYLDQVATTPIGSHTFNVLPTTYLGLPFRTETACIDWNVPHELQGPHRIWAEVWGDYPLAMQEDMVSNNYAVVDFFVNQPNIADPSVFGQCPASAAPLTTTPDPAPAQTCTTAYIRIPIAVRVCEDETLCGPVTGYELSYWDTLYWPSWSGYCQEFDVPQEAITDFIRTYETLVGLGSGGAGSSLPSLTDIPGILQPEGWSDGWLPCHPEPTLFPYILYSGLGAAPCGGLCPVSAWDCGQGVSFQPRFSSPYYNAYAFNVSGGAQRITRCHTEPDFIEVPYQICFPDDPDGEPGEPDQPFNVPFNPFAGAPGGPEAGYGGAGFAPSGPQGGPPIEFILTGPPLDPNDNILPLECVFCSTGSDTSNSTADTIHCYPDPCALALHHSHEIPYLSLDQLAQTVAQTIWTRNSNQTTSPPALCAALDNTHYPDYTLQPGQQVPDFRLPDADNHLRSLRHYRDQQLLLVFGDTRCPHCATLIPRLNSLAHTANPDALKVLFVAVGANAATAQQFIRDNGINFDVLLDARSRLARRFNINSVPQAFVISPTGLIQYATTHDGPTLWSLLAES